MRNRNIGREKRRRIEQNAINEVTQYTVIEMGNYLPTATRQISESDIENFFNNPAHHDLFDRQRKGITTTQNGYELTEDGIKACEELRCVMERTFHVKYYLTSHPWYERYEG